MQDSKSVNITSDFNTHSPQKMFNLTSVDIRNVQLDVKKLIFTTDIIKSLTENQIKEESTQFRLANGNLNINVNDKFSEEMVRITKKKPPNETTIQIIFTEFDENNSSTEDKKDISPTFKDLFSYPEQGRIYIGFSTQQTTGCCSHLAVNVIPTVCIY
jgi:hypothetical protein